jgi:hypothetical protein
VKLLILLDEKLMIILLSEPFWGFLEREFQIKKPRGIFEVMKNGEAYSACSSNKTRGNQLNKSFKSNPNNLLKFHPY